MCKYHQYPQLKNLITPPKTFIPNNSHCPFPVPSSPSTTDNHSTIYFPPIHIVYFGHFIKIKSCNIWPLGLASFTYHNISKVHPHCSMDQYFMPFYCHNISPWIEHLCLSIHQPIEIWVVSPFLATINNISMNIHI